MFVIRSGYVFVDMELYRVFYYVTVNGNITKAAQELFITQPAVSQSIKQLEEKLKVNLFIRLPKGVKLTPEGELLFSHVKEAYSLIQSAEKKIYEINSLEGGEIAIGADDIICKYYLLPIIEKYHKKYPKVKIRTYNITTREIIEGLKNGSLSCGLIKTPINASSIQIKECFDIKFCFAAGMQYKELSNQKFSLKELLEYPLIMLDKTCGSRHFLDDYFSTLGLSVNPEIELSNYDIIAEFAKIGLGMGCVIENFIQADLDNGSLFKLNIVEEIPPRKVALATLKDIPMSKPTETFVKMLA